MFAGVSVANSISNSSEDPLGLRMQGFQLLLKNEYKESIQLLEKALNGYKRLNRAPNISPTMRTNNLISQANIYMAMARAYYGTQDILGAIEQTQYALRIWKELGTFPNVAQAYTTLGVFYGKVGNTNESMRYFNQAIEKQKEIEAPEIWGTYYFLAKHYEKTDQRQEAKKHYELSISKIEELRGYLRTDETKVGFLWEKAAPFDDYVSFLLEKKPDGDYLLQALEVTERARARALLELLARKSTSSQLISDTQSNDENSFDETASSLNISPLKAEQILHEIKTGQTAYIDYFVTNQRTYAWLILPSGGVFLETITVSREVLSEKIKDSRDKMYLQQNIGQARNKAEDLYRLILNPLLTRLHREAPNCKKITFIPHSELHSLSFSSLPVGQSYWALEYEITYLPSLSIAHYLKPIHLNPNDRLLLIGNPAGIKPELKSSEEEVRGVASLFPNYSMLLSKDATQDAVISEMNRPYDAILISTHAVPDSVHPLMSHFNLAGDGKLTLKNITQAKLNTKLVVMSACETHIGERFVGDELMALTRGFLGAGSEYVLTTLWKVDQKPTSKIIIKFFDNLRAGYSPPEALRKSQIQYLQDKPDISKERRPFYWAPFILVGKNG